MATIEQIENFTLFAKSVSQAEGESIPLAQIYDRWWQEQHQDEDLLAIREAHAEYQKGERGELAREELTAFRSERAAGKKT